MKTITRRGFVAGAGVVAATLSNTVGVGSKRRFPGQICLFSKHLPDLGWKDLGRRVKAAGFDGVDLTVRPGGHVQPERAVEDLAQAIQTIRSEGAEVCMLTTSLTSAEDVTAAPIFSAAARMGVRFIKPGYYPYRFVDLRSELEGVRSELEGLVRLAAHYHVKLGFHNHPGYVGAPIWDIAGILERMDPNSLGYYFDLRHAVAEGGASAWKMAAKLVAPRLMMVAVKDFYWERTQGKGWRQKNCPLGEGMVDWPAYTRMLAEAAYRGPISLHLEYPAPGKTPGEVEDNTLAAAKRDLEFLENCLEKAYGA